MKQLNNNALTNSMNDREPNWCVLCDAKDKCDSCDATDWGDTDCGACDFGTECSHLG